MLQVNKDDSVLRVLLVRHGQTDHNVARILQGHIDTSLNAEGERQAGLVGDRLSSFPLDAFYSSDLTRCRQTSKAIYDKLTIEPKPEVQITDKLRERYMGVIEGKHIDEAVKFAESQGKHYKDFGENNKKFVERIDEMLNQILNDNLSNKNILLVSHGGTIRTILGILQYHDKSLVVYNTSVTIVDFDKTDFNKYTIKTVGDTKHLGDGEFKVNDSRVR